MTAAYAIEKQQHRVDNLLLRFSDWQLFGDRFGGVWFFIANASVSVSANVTVSIRIEVVQFRGNIVVNQDG